jgi:hypothetical protein
MPDRPAVKQMMRRVILVIPAAVCFRRLPAFWQLSASMHFLRADRPPQARRLRSRNAKDRPGEVATTVK